MADSVKLSWSNWNKVCELVPDNQFIVGTWLDEKGKPTTQTNINSQNSIGLLMKDPRGEVIVVRAGDRLVKRPSGKVGVQRG